MPSLFIYLVMVAALDSLNPTTTAVQIYLLTTPKPVARSMSFIVGVFGTYWAAGLGVALGVGRLGLSFPSLPDALFYMIQLIIGVVLFMVGWNLNKFSANSKEVKHPFRLTIVHTFLFGSAATLWDFPTALPYLAAIERIIRLQLDTLATISILAIYNLIFVLPLTVLLGLYIALGEQSIDLMRAIQRSMQRWGDKILRVLLVGLGFLLIADCIAYSFGHPIF